MKRKKPDFIELLGDVMAAFMFLSKVPIPWENFSEKPPDLTRSFWAFPLVGLILGSFSGIIALFFLISGFHSLISVIIGVCFGLILTGAIHEDGFAHSVDGFIEGENTSEIIEIMRDNKIGTYGALALILSLIIRVICLASLAYESSWLMFIGFATSGTIGKCMIVFLRSMSDPISDTGLSSLTERTEGGVLWSALGISFFSMIILLPFGIALSGFLLCLILTYGIRAIVERKIGGITGDILGATEQFSVLIFLIVFAGIYGL